MKKKLVVVLGMHRSGTSALTRGLTVLGAELGNNLLEANEQVNAKGFWEDKDILRLNIELMQALGLDWDVLSPISVADCNSEIARQFIPQALNILKNKLASVTLFAIKDPRVSILLPFWQQVFSLLDIEVYYLIASRNPKSVMHSLAKRDHFLPEKSYHLWQNYMLACLKYTQDQPRLVIDFDLLMTQPAVQLARIAELLSVPFSSENKVFDEYEKEFLDNSLRHTQYEFADLQQDEHITLSQQRLYQLLTELANENIDFDSKEYTRLFKRLTTEYRVIKPLLHVTGMQQRKLGKLTEKNIFLQQEHEVLTNHTVALNTQINELKNYVNELEPLKVVAEQHSQLSFNYSQLEKEHLRLTQVNAELTELYQQQSAQMVGVLQSLSWRFTAPLRATSKTLFGGADQLKAQWRDIKQGQGTTASLARKSEAAGRLSVVLCRQPSLILKGIRFVQQNGFTGAVERLRGIVSPHSGYFSTATLTTENIEHLVILTTAHCHYLAELMQASLAKVNIDSIIIHERPKGGFSNALHFVICPQMFDRLPNLYVAYQMEQSVSSRWFTPEYLTALEHSYGIFDYSLRNIKFLQEKGLSYKQLYYLPVGYMAATNLLKREEQVDVLFYGDINNERRRQYVAALQQKFSVKVVSNLFGEALYAEMAKAKVIVNIHYYEGALLETTRLYECLSQQQIVVSEESCDMDEHEALREVIDFVPINDIAAMVQRVGYWVENDAARTERRAEQLAWCEKSPNWFEFYFLRFLLANELISYDQFYDVAASHIRFSSDFLCLGLPETVERRADFDKDNHYGIEYFSGLRHRLGWVGCGLSYKFLLQRAQDLGLPRITICEDDVEFYSDFAQNYQQVLHYLDSRDDWDVYAGLIAQLHDEVELISCDKQGDKRYLTIDKMVSTVMNVYSERFYNKLIAWDPTNHDAQTNTIDRFIEQHQEMRVITTAKFLVGHKEELDSTLWGFNNQTYAQMIADSEAQLTQKLAEFDGFKAPLADSAAG